MANGTLNESSSASAAGFLSFRLPLLRALVGNFGWPILLKQLRTEFRRNRFFVTHFASLALLGCWLIIIMATETSDPNVTPTQVGQKIFNSFLGIQFFVVFVLFPVFSATAFTEERTHQTLDLLLITTLRPTEIVWGKFLATTIYCLMYVFATVPLLSISFLFGGVQVADVVLAYLVLIGSTLLVCMFSLCISSCSTSTVRSTLTVYVLLALMGGILWYLGLAAVFGQIGQNSGQTITQAMLASLGGGGVERGANGVVILIFMIDTLAIFTYLLLFATNRIRPGADDRSSMLRLLTFVYLPLRLFLSCVVGFEGPFDPNFTVGSSEIRAPIESTLKLATLLLLVVALLFSTEDANLSRRVCDKVRRRWARFTHRRIFAPGPFSGLLFTMLIASFTCALLFWVFELFLSPHADPLCRHLVYQTLGTLPIYLSAFASLGFLLAVSSFTPLYSRLTLTFVFVITLLLPMIFYLSRLPDRVYYFYYISPMALWYSLDRSEEEMLATAGGEVSYELYGVPIITVAKIVFAAAVVVNLTIGIWIARRVGFSLWSYRPVDPASPLSRAFQAEDVDGGADGEEDQSSDGPSTASTSPAPTI